MAKDTGVRKSGRKRRPNTKYSVDAFQGLDILDEADAGGELPSGVGGGDDDDDADEEFGANGDAEAAEAEEDDFSGNESVNENASAEEDVADAEELLDDESVIGSDTGPGEVQVRKRPFKVSFVGGSQRLRTDDSNATNVKYHIRGIPDIANHASKATRITYVFGSATEDLVPMIRARDKWNDHPPMPTRHIDNYGTGGMAQSFYYSEEMRQRERTTGWEWYYEQGGRDIFAQRQVNNCIKPEDGSRYFPKSLKNSHSFLMGPYKNQKLYKISLFDSFNLAEAWNHSSVPATGGGSSTKARKGRREGWLLNAGARIQCLDWVPNRKGATEYLAVTVTEDDLSVKHQYAPAYTPAPRSPGSIQIWAFATKQSAPDSDVEMNMSTPPRLAAVLCLDSSTVKQIKWCPMPDRESIEREGDIRLGLLAGIWADGKIRVLDIRFRESQTTQYIHIQAAAFEARPPRTICTSLTWLSTLSLAVGCANGSVAIYNLPAHLTTTTTSRFTPANTNPKPHLHLPLHHSYILSLVSAYPSRPYLLITSSTDGYLRLTDLRSPAHGDTVPSQRTRHGQAPLAWHDAAQAALSADENYTLRAYCVRRFYATVAVARVSAGVAAVATSACHPFSLVAGADGGVSCVNPFGKVYASKAEVWQCVWFRREWRRGVGEDGAGDEQVVGDGMGDAAGDGRGDAAGRRNGGDEKVLREPLSRFTDGYKVEKAYFAPEGGYRNAQDGVLYSTTYEEQTAVTAVCWNPNLECGGWAAAGMGSGLIRVEDLAL